MTPLDVKKFYVSLRDKHLSQLMEISGKVSFTALTVIVAVFLAIEDISKIKLDNLGGLFLVPGVVGMLLLGWGTAMFSMFHTKAIHDLEDRIRRVTVLPVLKDDEPNIYKILPSRVAHYLIFCGILLLFICALGVAFSAEPPVENPGK